MKTPPKKDEKIYEYFTPPKSAEKTLHELKTTKAELRVKKGEKKAFELFQYVSKNVPAYKKFLSEHKVDPTTIKSVKDFPKLPKMNKDVYLRKYEYADLFPNRDFSRVTTIAATSGTTGTPFYFPRGESGDAQHEYVSELFLLNQFDIKNKSSLVILSFALGIWIGGMITYKYFNQLARKGYDISTVPVGPNKDLLFKTISSLGKFYDQIILVGYPPFLKDTIDGMEKTGDSFKNYSVKIISAAEGYTEIFRDHVAEKAGIKNIYTDMVNIYGTVEMGGMAHETALTTLIRKLAHKNKEVFAKIFPNIKSMPTLAQYHPDIVYFEEEGDDLFATGFGSSIPLIRYFFPDRGGVIAFEEMVKKLKEAGVDIFAEAKKEKLEKYIVKLPFVYVEERSDGAVSLMSINIPPQVIKDALYDPSLVKICTGKFVLSKKENRNLDGSLSVHVEIKEGVTPTKKHKETIHRILTKYMRKNITEFDYLSAVNPQKSYLHVFPVKFSNPRFFNTAGKHRWVERGTV